MILDGTVIACDRCKEPAVSVTGEVIDLWYSGKTHRHGGNVQAVLAPHGFPLWVSEAELARDFGVAYDTVRRAAVLLRERGLIITVHGRGTYVA